MLHLHCLQKPKPQHPSNLHHFNAHISSLYTKWEEQMHSLQSIYEVGSCSETYNFLQEVLNSADEALNIENSNVSTISMAEAKVAAANKSHSEAERRRRKRINGHLATLRSLLPNTIKTDKASLLAEVVRSIRELKKTTADLASTDDVDEFSHNISNSAIKHLLPSESDELKLCHCEGDSGIIKATICCEDRPDIILDLTRALNSVQARVVRAEMATVGGRTKTVVWVKVSTAAGEEGPAKLRRALKVVIDKSILLPTPGQSLPGHKRPRLYQC